MGIIFIIFGIITGHALAMLPNHQLASEIEFRKTGKLSRPRPYHQSLSTGRLNEATKGLHCNDQATRVLNDERIRQFKHRCRFVDKGKPVAIMQPIIHQEKECRGKVCRHNCIANQFWACQ